MERTGGDAPYFLVTIDAEGDSIWSRPSLVTTRNARWLPRFQSLCERHGMRPTYLTNFEMARSDSFRDLALDALRRCTAEVGMHLHAWNSPPDAPLGANDTHTQPYLIEYPTDVMRDKIDAMTDLITERFGERPRSHRAGRWAFDERYARLLAERGYAVDCSVTPGVSWRRHAGHPGGAGGSDYAGYPEESYYLDLDDIRRPGDSSLLEVPMTVVRPGRSLRRAVEGALGASLWVRGALRRCFPPRWLRPNGRNRSDLISLVRKAARDGRRYVEFMLHSSELMPGASPTFPDESAIEALYEDLEALFEAASAFRKATLVEYAAAFAATAAEPV